MNCKPGDLAFIVRSDFPENIGKPVEVLNLGVQVEQGFVWYVKSSSLLAGWAEGETVGYATHLRIFDHDLRPISPPLFRDDACIEDTFDPVFVALGISR